MTIRGSLFHKAIALMIVFSFSQFCVLSALADTTILPTLPQTIMGRLATRNNQSVLVNGSSVPGGTTIMSGATIETPDGVGATIYLGALGNVDIAPNSKVLIEFSDGQIKLTITQGCAIVRNKQGTYAQIFTEKGLATSNDPATKPASELDVCYPSGAPAPIVNQGAASNAGAGVGVVAADSIHPAVWVVLFGGGGALVALVAANRGDNDSR